MKKELPLTILALLIAASLTGQNKSYDIITLLPPAGWTQKEASGSLSFTNVDNIRKVYGMITIYAAVNSSGNIENDFRATWDELVRPVFGSVNTPVPEKSKRPDGYDVRKGSSSVMYAGKKTEVLVVNFTGAGKTLTVLISYTDTKYEAINNTFLKNIVFKPIAPDNPSFGGDQPVTGPQSLPAAAMNNSSEGSMASLIGNNGISGVWMSMIFSINGSEMKCITIFNNGEIRELMPREGYRNLDQAADKRDHSANWGSYRKEGAIYSVTRPSASQYKGKITPVSENKIEFDGDTYQRIPSFDGFMLNGSYTSMADPDDELPGDVHQPLITFSADGRFNDKGILYVLDITGTDGDQNGGSGRYEIKSYTLTLRYDDGRVRNYSITGFLASPAVSDKSIVVCNAKLNKRSK